jgi:hypothetical protein
MHGAEGLHGLVEGWLTWADGESYESRNIGGARNRVLLTQCKRSRKSLSHKTRLAAIRKRTLDAGRGRAVEASAKSSCEFTMGKATLFAGNP